jgi:aspartate/methionine/tyrosine aminotransferase
VRALVDIARRHDLVVMADEIYEKIIFDDAVHHHAATFAEDDVLCLTFSGLSKAYRVCGYRAGWVMVSGPKHLASDFLEGLTLLANMRMCANVPAQHAIPDRPRWLPVDHRARRARRPVLRAEQARLPTAQRDPRGLVRRTDGCALLLPAPGSGGLPDRERRGVRHRPCCAPRRSS